MSPDNDARDKWCLACRAHRRWDQTTCPSCGAALVEEGEGSAPDPAMDLVSVFRIRDGAVVPLATIALESAGIEYDMRARNTLIPGIARGGGEHTGYDREVPGEIFVRSEDAQRARDLLADLDHPAPPDPAVAEPTPDEWSAAEIPAPEPHRDPE